MSKSILLLLVAIFAFSFSHAYISDIEVDVNNGQIYVTAANILYELDNAAVTQNSVHYTPGDTEAGTLFVGKRNNKRVLYDYLSTEAGGNNFVYYPVPLKNQDTLVPSQSTVMDPKGLTLNSVYDQKDHISVHSVSRNFTLVDTNSMAILDTVQEWTGSRKFGRNMVYNNQNKHVLAFYTYVPIHGAYGISVDEYDVSSGKFVEVDTTYNCLCDDGYNATESPFYKVVLIENSCTTDYSVSPARIWCAWGEGKKLFSFQANDLSKFQVISTPASFDGVAWDFANRFVYAVNGNTDTGAVGFTVAKVRLSNGSVVNTYTNTAISVDSSVLELDPNEPHLYLAVASETAADKLVSLNTNNMATAKVVTLTPPSA